jgi:hypothetical protein
MSQALNVVIDSSFSFCFYHIFFYCFNDSSNVGCTASAQQMTVAMSVAQQVLNKCPPVFRVEKC